MMRLRPVAMRDVRSLALTNPSPSRECLCKTVADKRDDPRGRSAMEPLDASKTSVTHRGRCCRTGYGWIVASRVLLSGLRSDLRSRIEIENVRRERVIIILRGGNQFVWKFK